MGELVDRVDIVQSGPAVDTECTPVHGLAVFDQLCSTVFGRDCCHLSAFFDGGVV